MHEVLAFVREYFGLIGIAVLFGIKLAVDYNRARDKIKSLIFVAEERARDLLLTTGEKKFNWVCVNGYQYLPAWLRLVMSQAMFCDLVQKVFDTMVNWAEAQELRPKHTKL